MNMIWTDIWDMDTVSVSTRPHFLVDKAPEPHDGRVVLRLNDFQPKSLHQLHQPSQCIHPWLPVAVLV